MALGVMIHPRFDSARHSIFSIARHKFAWPGGYALLMVTRDGCCLCADCVRENVARIVRDTRDPDYNTGWEYAGYQIAECMDDESPERCAHCNRDLAAL